MCRYFTQYNGVPAYTFCGLPRATSGGGLAKTLNRPGMQRGVIALHSFRRNNRNGRPFAVVQRVEKVDPSDRAPAAMVKVPAHQLALIGPGFLLDRVIKNQH